MSLLGFPFFAGLDQGLKIPQLQLVSDLNGQSKWLFFAGRTTFPEDKSVWK